MSGDTQQDYITSLLDLMVQKSFLPANMNPADRLDLETNLSFRAGQLMTQYEQDRKEAEGLAPEAKRRKEFEKQTENLAKALPNITKGTLAAITAFQKDDPISGSAAVMDVCASLAPLLGGLAAAGGPPGMLVGAIFAMIGQILSFFSPKSESITTQIADILRKLQGEEKTQTIKAVHTNITTYASSLKLAIHALANSDASDSADVLVRQIGVISRIMKDFNPIEGNTITLFWQVTEWMQEPNNQSQEQWPIILGAACQAYTDLLVTHIMLLSLCSPDAMKQQLEALPAENRSVVKAALNKLLVVATARLIEFGACTETQLGYLRRIVPAAQNRGMFWYIDDTRRGYLYGGTNIRKGSFAYLKGEQKRIAVTMALKDIVASSPTYHLFALEIWIDQGYSGYDRTYHGVESTPYKSVAWKELNCASSSLHGLSDIWATPGARADKDEVYFYGTRDTGLNGYVLDKNNKVTFAYSRILKSRAMAVRVVHAPQAFAEDPDENNRSSVLKGVEYMTYGGLAASPEIFVDAFGQEGYIASPWGGYSGLGIDQHYIWVFGPGGFACATHASVLRCLRGEIPKPRWMGHYPDGLLYTPRYHADQSKVGPTERSPLKGLIDLGACEDGTLVASLFTRSVVYNPRTMPNTLDYYSFVDENALYSMVYQTDLKKGTLSVDWTKIEGNRGVRVHKLPVFCWPMLKSLTTSLEQIAPALKQGTALSA